MLAWMQQPQKQQVLQCRLIKNERVWKQKRNQYRLKYMYKMWYEFK